MKSWIFCHLKSGNPGHISKVVSAEPHLSTSTGDSTFYNENSIDLSYTLQKHAVAAFHRNTKVQFASR